MKKSRLMVRHGLLDYVGVEGAIRPKSEITARKLSLLSRLTGGR